MILNQSDKDKKSQKILEIQNDIIENQNRLSGLQDRLKKLQNSESQIKDNFKWYEIKQKRNEKSEIESTISEVENLILESQNKINSLERQKKLLNSKGKAKSISIIAIALIVILTIIGMIINTHQSSNSYENPSYSETDCSFDETNEISNGLTTEPLQSFSEAGYISNTSSVNDVTKNTKTTDYNLSESQIIGIGTSDKSEKSTFKTIVTTSTTKVTTKKTSKSSIPSTTKSTAKTSNKVTTTKKRITEVERGQCNYVGNLNSHIFHYPTCGSVTNMKDSNKIYFYSSRDEIIKSGYKPCQNCRP